MIFLTIVALAVEDSDLLLTIFPSTEFRIVNFAKKVLIVHVTNWRSKFIYQDLCIITVGKSKLS